MLQRNYQLGFLGLFSGLIILLSLSCSSSNQKKVNSLQAYTVKKNDFINTMTVSGVLETSRSISVTCPVRGYDLNIDWIIEEGTIAHKGDTLCKLECADLETRYNEAMKNANVARSNYEKAKAQQELESSLLQSQIQTNDASTKIAMLDSSKLAFLSPANRRITELKLEKAMIEKNKLVRRLEFMKKINNSALRALQTRIQIQERNMQTEGTNIEKLIIISDTSGIVRYDNNMITGKKIKPGDIIWGSLPILKLVDLSEFQVRLFVNENQYQNIQKDLKTEMVIDAYQNIKLKGKITQKKPSGKPVRENSNVKVFEIVTSIDSLPVSLQPGVSVTCKVYLNTLKDTITIPLMSVFEKDSLKVVYVRHQGKIQRRTITTSLLSDKFIVVTNGLKPKDQILLTEPPEYLLK
jgi:HlyD family secretion protein